NRKRSVLLSCGRFDTCRRSTLSCWRRIRISATSFVLGLKNEAMIWRISWRNSIIKWQGYRVSASRPAESNFRYTQGRHQAGDLCLDNVATLGRQLEIADGFRQAEHAHGDVGEADAVGELSPTRRASTNAKNTIWGLLRAPGTWRTFSTGAAKSPVRPQQSPKEMSSYCVIVTF